MLHICYANGIGAFPWNLETRQLRVHANSIRTSCAPARATAYGGLAGNCLFLVIRRVNGKGRDSRDSPVIPGPSDRDRQAQEGSFPRIWAVSLILLCHVSRGLAACLSRGMNKLLVRSIGVREPSPSGFGYGPGNRLARQAAPSARRDNF